jgi:endo-1,4-beta-xylanase
MLTEYGKLGVKLMITELDVSVLPVPGQQADADVTRRVAANAAGNPYAEGLPAEKQRELAKRYADIFKIFMKHRDKIDRVTFWGVHDGQSWRNGWPTRNRTDYPLLFDRQHQPKPAFDAVVETAN